MKLSLLVILLCAGGQSVVAEAQNRDAEKRATVSAPDITKIRQTWFTRAGEGADSSIELSSDGNFQSRHGGDIGNGTDHYTNVSGKIQGPELLALFVEAAHISRFAAKPIPRQRRMEQRVVFFERANGMTHAHNAENDPGKSMSDRMTHLISDHMAAATQRLQPTAEHVVYEFQSRAKCTEKQRARTTPPEHCAHSPSLFYVRTDGLWQCHQARAARRGVESFSTGGKGASFRPKKWPTQMQRSSTSVASREWTVSVRSKAGTVYLRRPKSAVKTWKRSAKKLSSLCWPK